MVRQDLDLLVPHGFQLDQGVQAVHRFPGDQALPAVGEVVEVGVEEEEEEVHNRILHKMEHNN